MSKGIAVVDKAKSFIARLEEVEQMERFGTSLVQVAARFTKFISDLFAFLQENRFQHEIRVLQEISTRIEDSDDIYSLSEPPVRPGIQRAEEIKAMLGELVSSLESSGATDAASKLHPLPPILAAAAELPSSSQFMTVIGATGVEVDFTCDDKLSHAARIRLYQQRFQASYDALDDDDKLRVAWVLAKEVQAMAEQIQHVKPGLGERLKQRLERIGWKIESDRLVPAKGSVAELFFPKGSQHDAYVQIKEIMGKAKSCLRIADNYVNGELFSVIESLSQRPQKIEILTSKMPADFAVQAKKFMEQHPWAKIEIKKTSDLHDRFIIIDDNRAYHLGASIKDFGGKTAMISEIEAEGIRKAVILHVSTIWNGAAPVEK